MRKGQKETKHDHMTKPHNRTHMLRFQTGKTVVNFHSHYPAFLLFGNSLWGAVFGHQMDQENHMLISTKEKEIPNKISILFYLELLVSTSLDPS